MTAEYNTAIIRSRILPLVVMSNMLSISFLMKFQQEPTARISKYKMEENTEIYEPRRFFSKPCYRHRIKQEKHYSHRHFQFSHFLVSHDFPPPSISYLPLCKANPCRIRFFRSASSRRNPVYCGRDVRSKSPDDSASLLQGHDADR